MKKFLQGVALFLSFLLALPLLLKVTYYVVSFAFFYSHLSRGDNTVCAQYYEGVDKGIAWENGEWHHYVDFEVDDTDTFLRLRVTDAPLPTSLWWDHSNSSIKRFAYRWPSNWWDPFPASDWKICAVGSS